MTDQPDSIDDPIDDETLAGMLGPLTLALVEALTEEPDDFALAVRIFADCKKAIAMLNEVAQAAERRAVELIPWEDVLNRDGEPSGRRRRATLTVHGVGSFTVSRPAIKTVWADDTLELYLERCRELGELNGPSDVPALVAKVLYAGTQYKKTVMREYLDLDPLVEEQYGEPRLRWL